MSTQDHFIYIKVGGKDLPIFLTKEMPNNAIAINTGKVLHVWIDGRHAYTLTREDFLNLATRKAVIHTKP